MRLISPGNWRIRIGACILALGVVLYIPWMLANLNDYVHISGSCRMGAPDDDDAVVDPTGRVIGYEGLRVCDASIFPDLPRANTHLPTVMVAERIATMIATDA